MRVKSKKKCQVEELFKKICDDGELFTKNCKGEEHFKKSYEGEEQTAKKSNCPSSSFFILGFNEFLIFINKYKL